MPFPATLSSPPSSSPIELVASLSTLSLPISPPLVSRSSPSSLQSVFSSSTLDFSSPPDSDADTEMGTDRVVEGLPIEAVYARGRGVKLAFFFFGCKDEGYPGYTLVWPFQY
jgi:hypothetical protein